MAGLVLGGTASGVGKTVATLAVVRALTDAGVEVQPAKAGPDFIDPSHHEAVAGTPSRTLDLWLQGEDGLRRNYDGGADEADCCVVEGVMGLYDGECSSTAMVAEALSLPVVLVVDAKAGMESVAATALGFREYADRIDRDVEVAGVLAQRCHGGRHERGIREALPDDLSYVGRVPPREDLEIPDRHLGLEMGSESPLEDDALADAAAHLDVDALREVAREPSAGPGSGGRSREVGDASVAAGTEPSADRPRVAVASDEAFCFTYAATFERLGDLADVVTFSPVAGDPLPDCDGVYLPGGYPELHADALSGAPALDALADRAADGLPVYGECGGMMVLAESLTTADGETHEMAGVLPASVRMHDRYQALDHVELRARVDAPTAEQGERLRGHEFHYSSVEADVDADPAATYAFDVERGDGMDGDRDGLLVERTLGTYCHCHPESGAFDAFCARL